MTDATQPTPEDRLEVLLRTPLGQAARAWLWDVHNHVIRSSVLALVFICASTLGYRCYAPLPPWSGVPWLLSMLGFVVWARLLWHAYARAGVLGALVVAGSVYAATTLAWTAFGSICPN